MKQFTPVAFLFTGRIKSFRKLLAITALILTSQLSVAQQNWVKVSCGMEYSLALRSDGTLWAWGFNGNGQLGTGNTNQADAPVQVGTDNDWTDIATGSFHSMAIKSNGTLWAWGLNGNGQVGDGTKMNEDSLPKQIGTDTDWKEIAGGTAHSLAIKTNGTLWAWGLNYSGQLGIGSNNDADSPVQVGTETTWTKISGGGGHTMALKNDGTLWLWGDNSVGQLGFPDSTATSSPLQITDDNNWLGVSAGYEFSLAIKTDGTIWSWGFSGNGQLGFGNTQEQEIPTKIGTDTNWKSIVAGSAFSFGIKSDSSLYSWGFNGNGQLGTGNTSQEDAPVKVTGVSRVITIAAARGADISNVVFGGHAVAIEGDATTICTAGAGYVGQQGDGSAENDYFTCDVDVVNAVNEVMAPDEITVYPNPSNGRFSINYNGFNNDSRIEVINVFGQQILSESQISDNESTTNLDLSGFAKGPYFLKIYDKNGAVIVKKLILD